MTLCRCCHKPLDAQKQPALVPGRPPLTLVTCRNPFCGMNGYTLSLDSYADVDLDRYCPPPAINDAIAQAEQLAARRAARIFEEVALFGEYRAKNSAEAAE